MKTRIVSATEKGRKVILSLACRHSLTKELDWYRRRDGFRYSFVHCPQCGGFKR